MLLVLFHSLVPGNELESSVGAEANALRITIAEEAFLGFLGLGIDHDHAPGADLLAGSAANALGLIDNAGTGGRISADRFLRAGIAAEGVFALAAGLAHDAPVTELAIASPIRGGRALLAIIDVPADFDARDVGVGLAIVRHRAVDLAASASGAARGIMDDGTGSGRPGTLCAALRSSSGAAAQEIEQGNGEDRPSNTLSALLEEFASARGLVDKVIHDTGFLFIIVHAPASQPFLLLVQNRRKKIRYTSILTRGPPVVNFIWNFFSFKNTLLSPVRFIFS